MAFTGPPAGENSLARTKLLSLLAPYWINILGEVYSALLDLIQLSRVVTQVILRCVDKIWKILHFLR